MCSQTPAGQEWISFYVLYRLLWEWAHEVKVQSFKVMLVGLLLSGSGFVCLPAQAANIVTQLTSDPGWNSFSPSLSADGTKVAFDSNANLTGGNADNSFEIFVLGTDGTGITQLTSDPVVHSRRPSLSADGSKVAFYSEADHTGGNPDGSDELFVVNADGTGIVQLTSDPVWYPTFFPFPSLSADGSKVAFSSPEDLSGGNPGKLNGLFVISTDGTGLVQLTSAGVGAYLSLSADGSKVAFESSADLTGGNPDGSYEIFVINTDGTGLVQLSNDPVGGGNTISFPSLSADGSKVAFESGADLTGGNADNSGEIFVMNTDGTGLVQLTSAPGRDSRYPSLSADGTKVAFSSSADLTGGNPAGLNSMFLMNTDGTGLVQLTSVQLWLTSGPSLSADGTKVAFSSSADLTGDNQDNSVEIFLINVGLPPLPPGISADGSSPCIGSFIRRDNPHSMWGLAVLPLMLLAVRVARRKA